MCKRMQAIEKYEINHFQHFMQIASNQTNPNYFELHFFPHIFFFFNNWFST